MTARTWRGRRYLVSPFADLALAGGLAPVVFLAVFLLFPPHTPGIATQKLYLGALMGWLAFLVNDPHFIVSYQLLYDRYFEKLRRFRSHRELWLRYLIAGIAVPALMAMYFAYALAMQRMELFSYAVSVMLVVVGWHYAKQAYGVFIVLSALKGIHYSPARRWWLRANSYVVWLSYFLDVLIEPPTSNRNLSDALGFDYRPIPYHLTLTPALSDWLGGIIVFFGAAALFAAVWDKRAPYYSRTALTGYFSMYYLMLLSGLHPFWIIMYPFFHSLQYLLFVFAYKRGEVAALRAEGLDAAAVRRRWQRFLLMALLAGIFFFAALPQTLEGWLNPAHTFVFPAVLAIATFINIHHYFIDNVIWRKEHTEIGRYLFAQP